MRAERNNKVSKDRHNERAQELSSFWVKPPELVGIVWLMRGDLNKNSLFRRAWTTADVTECLISFLLMPPCRYGFQSVEAWIRASVCVTRCVLVSHILKSLCVYSCIYCFMRGYDWLRLVHSLLCNCFSVTWLWLTVAQQLISKSIFIAAVTGLWILHAQNFYSKIIKLIYWSVHSKYFDLWKVFVANWHLGTTSHHVWGGNVCLCRFAHVVVC